MAAKPTYLIELDPRRNHIRLTFSGHMDHATTDSFEQELAEAFARMPSEGGRPGEYLLLADIRTSTVQSRDITARMQGIIAHYSSLSRRKAMLVSVSPLEMMQAKRVAAVEGTAFFVREDDALAWLFSDQDSVATPAAATRA